nr:translocation/assembly module TamB domain-containing protein [Nitrospiraceae bacterium]
RRWDLEWRLNAKNLGEMLPNAGGRLSARGTLKGRGKPVVTARIAGRGVRYGKYKIENLRSAFTIDLSDRASSKIDLTAAGLEAGRLTLRAIRMKAAGRLALHSITLSAEGKRTAVALSLTGGYSRGVWNGDIMRLRLSEPRYGAWGLVRPAPLTISKTAAAADICLSKARAMICLKADLKRSKEAHVTLALSRVPLDLFHLLLPPGMQVTGTLGGGADVLYSKGALAGKADIRLVGGSVLYSLKGKKMRLSFKESVLKMQSANRTVTVDWEMPFVEGGGITSRFVIRNRTTIKGNIRMELPNLNIVSAVLPAVKNASGVLKAGLDVSGPLRNPNLSGQLAVEKASAPLPTLGIKLTGISLTAKSDGKNRFLLDGVFHSGPGAIGIKGDLARTPSKLWKADLNIKGKDFLAFKTPMAQVQASPDLELTLLDRKIALKGQVVIPLADIRIKKIPSEAVKPSPDVVIVGQKKIRVKAVKFEISADITVVLGNRITFDGFGLKSRIAGSVAVHEAPGKIATGRGELVIVKGRYKAYGQNLAISQGKLFFGGGPVDDPGLDIRATRKAQNDVIAGIHVTGTLKAPRLVVFSEPAMDETDALAYLVLGKPLGSASSSQGSLLYTAATTAGLAGGKFIASKIGALFGITKVTVEKGPATTPSGQEQATLFLGRYLSPRLYVAYGIGLFETSNVFRVRYRLTRDWLVQTETGTETGGDVLWEFQW